MWKQQGHCGHKPCLSFKTMWAQGTKLKLLYSVFAQGGRRRRRQPGRRQQPTRHHLHRLQDVSEHRRQRQGRTHAGICDELMARSCLSPTGFPRQLLWAWAGSSCRETQAGVVCVFLGTWGQLDDLLKCGWGEKSSHGHREAVSEERPLQVVRRHLCKWGVPSSLSHTSKPVLNLHQSAIHDFRHVKSLLLIVLMQNEFESF